MKRNEMSEKGRHLKHDTREREWRNEGKKEKSNKDIELKERSCA